MKDHRWICCQLGAREHYAVPRALCCSTALDRLITDIWVRPYSLLSTVNNGLSQRFHPALADANVHAHNLAAAFFEARSRLHPLASWRLIQTRNEWFQRRSIATLEHVFRVKRSEKFTLFAYSYAAIRLLKFARIQGWNIVLGQIDPGPAEELIVKRLFDETPVLRGEWQPAPTEYWQNWREECELAECIMVNSAWSREALAQQGVDAKKIRVIPLAFETSPEAKSFTRHYPEAFTAERPLRVLFLGQINLRKGVGPLLDAVTRLRGEPIEFWFVGPVQITLGEQLKRERQIRWVGAVPRRETAKYYREADVFILPTFSDGFGLTQLEAQAWKLPVIASRFCGDVVRPGVNGVLLEELSCEAIAKVVLEFVRDPAKLSHLAVHSGVDDRFSLKTLNQSLLAL